MPNRPSTFLPCLAALLAAGVWACAPDAPTGPDTTARPSAGAAVAASYTIRDLGTLGGRYAFANAINDAGVIAGARGVRGNVRAIHAIVWKNGVVTDLGTLGGDSSEATAINEDGTVVGWSQNKLGFRRAVQWKNGVKKSLGTLGGRNSEARGVNAFGVIVGWSETVSGDKHAFVWKNGVMTDIGTLGGAYSAAYGINRGGVVVGGSTTALGEDHAFRWKDGVFKDLHDPKWLNSTAVAVNTKGQIVGTDFGIRGGEGEDLEIARPFLFYRDVRTGAGFARLETYPTAISPTGTIVAWDFDPFQNDATSDPLVIENGVIQRLPELRADDNAVPTGVNRAGTIVGNSGGRAVLWRRQ